ncbi:hypothetical protein EXU30_19685 [Shewanella maritima]|uniref:Uncharacterized protein n=1 Tax=Shewanella maritima TaxID=2520507 RepID=A0A411PM78_9GAMM|nr:hypothetical protein [Shewanella maritima]QBF84647.1 hypothetical protein EXU30_19685 [Shewanella maritima]
MSVHKLKAAIRKSLKSGAAPKTVAHIHGVSIQDVQAIQSESRGSKVQARKRAEIKEVNDLKKEQRERPRDEDEQYAPFSQNQFNLTIKKVYDELAVGSSPAVHTCLGLAGVPESDQPAIARREVPRMNRAAWDANSNHPEALAMTAAKYRTRTDKADACNKSVSHMVKSIQEKHGRLKSLCELQNEIQQMRKEMAELQAFKQSATVRLNDQDWKTQALAMSADGIRPIDISRQLDINVGTVRSFLSRSK